MITNKGKDVLTKYLLGQTATYATYISFGCGATPGGTPTGNETAMEFEMVRVPISSRSLSKVGEDKMISLAGELPLTEHYKITEVAVWSDSSNSLSATNTDSRVVFAFDNAENWQGYKNLDGILTNYTIPFINTAIGNEDGTITEDEQIFACNATNATLQAENRINAGQGVRFLDNTIMMRGDCWVNEESEMHGIRLQAFSLDLSKAAPSDEIRIALGLYPVFVDGLEGNLAEDINLRLRLRFLTETTQLVNGVAEQIAATIDVTVAPQEGEYYHIVSIPKNEFSFTSNFSWEDVSAADITVGVTPADGVGEDVNKKWYVGIDAVRFENLTTPNPLYAMVGYAISDTIIEKFANTNAYSEFRFGIDTQ